MGFQSMNFFLDVRIFCGCINVHQIKIYKFYGLPFRKDSTGIKISTLTIAVHEVLQSCKCYFGALAVDFT
jgi:hypothetical protein